MKIIVDKSNSKNLLKIISEKLNKKPKSGNLNKHFGKLKRNFNGLAYQLAKRGIEV